MTGTRVHAVEVSEEAAAYASRNLADTTVELYVQDMIGALPRAERQSRSGDRQPALYPVEAFESVVPEARDHDPLLALFAGQDGLDVIRVVVAEAARLLRPAGLLCVEHADVQGESAQQVVVTHGGFAGVRDHSDLTGRSRFVTAIRRS